jgi:putative sterol carrier protein
MQRAHPPREISPSEFFLRWIPEAVARDESRKARLRDTAATIEFTLRGAEGGVFTLRVEGGEVQGCHGEAASADLRVELDVGVWRQLNSGELSAPEAVLKRQLKFSGSFLLALKLQLILS